MIYLMTDLLDIALELLVSDGQGVEELLQADCGALLPWMGRLLHQVAFLVKHQLGPHLAGLMARHHTQVAGTRRSEGILSKETVTQDIHAEWKWLLMCFYLRAHKELRASPLKPKVSTWMRSEKSLSFDVWCFSAVDCKKFHVNIKSRWTFSLKKWR